MQSTFTLTAVRVSLALAGSLAVLTASIDAGSKTNGSKPSEKRVKELEQTVASLRKQIDTLRKKLKKPSPIIVVQLKYLDITQATHIINRVIRGKPRVEVAGLPRLQCVVIKADGNTNQRLRQFLRQLDKLAGKRLPSRFNKSNRVRLREDEVELQIVIWRLNQLRVPKRESNSAALPTKYLTSLATATWTGLR